MTTQHSTLASPVKLGSTTLRNKVIMAPLTRMRAQENLAPSAISATYYAQRASAGLIITEASQISQQGQGYPLTPGIYTAAHIAGWKAVTEAVHQEGGAIFIQLWHVGKISHSSFQVGNNPPVSSSAIAALGNAYTADFSRVAYEIPHALTVEEIQAIVNDYKQAAIHAKEAGFDGVEIHAANGYLIEQFLKSVANNRTDKYGGSFENRARFLFEVLDAILEVLPVDKVGIRLSPFFSAYMPEEPDPLPFYDYLIKRLADYGLAYLHIIEQEGSTKNFSTDDKDAETDGLLIKHIRQIYPHPIIAAGGFTKRKAEKAIELGYADAIAFGRAFISTPDLPYRLFNDIPLNELDYNSIYGGDSKGYTDYPTL